MVKMVIYFIHAEDTLTPDILIKSRTTGITSANFGQDIGCRLKSDIACPFIQAGLRKDDSISFASIQKILITLRKRSKNTASSEAVFLTCLVLRLDDRTDSILKLKPALHELIQPPLELFAVAPAGFKLRRIANVADSG